MAKMTDAEWEQYQREGRHLRDDQRTTDLKKMVDNRENLSDIERQLLVMAECRELLKSIRNMLVFFVVLAVIGLILGFLSVVK
jgi:uncharacterized membrane protein (DUF106 family)